jgi:hypothetical protein
MMRLTWALYLLLALGAACRSEESRPVTLRAEVPLHLEEHVDHSILQGSELPKDVATPAVWRFDEGSSPWKAATPLLEGLEPVELVYVEDALRLQMRTPNRNPRKRLDGTIYVELPDWNLDDWVYVEVEARASGPMSRMGLSFNYTEKDPFSSEDLPFYSRGDRTPLIGDGAVHRYRLSLDSPRMRPWEGPWRHLALWATSAVGEESIDLDILSVKVIPLEATYATGLISSTIENFSVMWPDSLTRPSAR